MPPTIRVNTFIKPNEKCHVDVISKIFIVLQIMFGLNGMPLIGKEKCVYKSLSIVLSLVLHGFVISFAVRHNNAESITVIVIITIVRSFITTALSYLRYKWIQKFYNKLHEFDEIAGCRPKVSKSSTWNVVFASFICVFLFSLFIPNKISGRIYMVPLHIVYGLEVFYLSHLLTLLIPRLKLINYYNDSSLSTSTFAPNSFQKEFVYLKCYDAIIDQCQIRRLMELYQILVEAFDFLVDGIKWQLLFAIIASFIKILSFLYVITLSTIRNGVVASDITSIGKMGIVVVVMLPLFAPCVFSGRLHNEVKKLRELLASRLLEKKLDKTDRRTARAFLAFTETRDLSFRLLRMLNIDISLPFKYVGLLVTYLIILLQFNKVINP